jgi:hypothetical protein
MPWPATYAAVPAIGTPEPVQPPARVAEPQAKARPVPLLDPNTIIRDAVAENKRSAEAKATQARNEAVKKQKAELRAPLPVARSASYFITVFGRSPFRIATRFRDRGARPRWGPIGHACEPRVHEHMDKVGLIRPASASSPSASAGPASSTSSASPGAAPAAAASSASAAASPPASRRPLPRPLDKVAPPAPQPLSISPVAAQQMPEIEFPELLA